MFSAATELSFLLIQEMNIDEYETTEEGLIVTDKEYNHE